VFASGRICIDLKRVGREELYGEDKYRLLRNFFLKLFAEAPEEVRRKETEVFGAVHRFLNSLDKESFNLRGCGEEAVEFFRSYVNPVLRGADLGVDDEGTVLFKLSDFEVRLNSFRELFFYCFFSGSPIETILPFYYVDDHRQEFLNVNTRLLDDLCVPVDQFLSFLLRLSIPGSAGKPFLKKVLERWLRNEESAAEREVWRSLGRKAEVGDGWLITDRGVRIASIIGNSLHAGFIEEFFSEHWEEYDDLKKQVMAFVYISAEGAKLEWVSKNFEVIKRVIDRNPSILKFVMDKTGLVFAVCRGEFTGDGVFFGNTYRSLYDFQKPKKSRNFKGKLVL